MFSSAALVAALVKAKVYPNIQTDEPVILSKEVLSTVADIVTVQEDTASTTGSQATIVDEDILVRLQSAVQSLFGASEDVKTRITDANHAVDYVAHCLSDIVFVYPGITTDAYLGQALKGWATAETPIRNGQGDLVKVVEMETRTGALTAVQGALAEASSKTISVLTSSQALLSMIPNLHALATARQSVVFHVASHYVDQDLVAHSNVDAVLAARNTGALLLASSTVQEAHDMALVAHLLSRAVQLPVIHYFDGVSASRDIQKVNLLSYGRIAALVAAQTVQKSNNYNEAAATAKALLAQFNYKPFDYFGDASAETVLITLGASSSSIATAVSRATKFLSTRVGLVSVRLYRPWSEADLIAALPQSATRLVVLEEGDGLFAFNGPLFLDIAAAVRFSSLSVKPRLVTAQASSFHHLNASHMPLLIEQAAQATFVDLQTAPFVATLKDETEAEEKAWQASFWDSSAETALQIVHLLHQDTASTVQAEIVSDALHVGGPVINTRLTTAKSTAGRQVDYLGIHDTSLIREYDVLALAKSKAVVVLNGPWKHGDDIEAHLTNEFKLKATQLEIKLYTIDSARVAHELGLHQSAVHLVWEAVFGLLVKPTDLVKRLTALYRAVVSNEQDKRDLKTVVSEVVEKVTAELTHIELLAPWTILEINDIVLPIAPLNRPVASDESEEQVSQVTEEEGGASAEVTKWHKAAWNLMFKESFQTTESARPDIHEPTYVVRLTENRRLTADSYDRNVFHLEFDTTDSNLTYNLGDALGVYGHNDYDEVRAFLEWYGLKENDIILIGDEKKEARSLFQLFSQTLDLFGRPSKKFYETLASFATDPKERDQLLFLISPEGKEDFKKRVDETVTYEDLLREFTSAKPPVEALVLMVSPIKPRHYSIASSQKMHPGQVHLLVVAVDWENTMGKKRFGQCTRYMANMKLGTQVTVSIKSSVMKLPPLDTQPVIMAGLGTGMAPFRAFIQERSIAKAAGKEVGPVVLYFGSRNRRNEYLYGEELEAYLADGVLSHMGLAFSRDQVEKVYIQHKMKEDAKMLSDYLVNKDGHFYLCGPTWPVPDVKDALVYGLEHHTNIDAAKASALIEEWKEKEKYILEVY
ncbi:hypothetical protein CLU79DRAFT_721465 [Phycomyces nitens]|nr:hypothetical protein CLU79DRAFT_721465 [Phycomyces nitens]